MSIEAKSERLRVMWDTVEGREADKKQAQKINMENRVRKEVMGRREK